MRNVIIHQVAITVGVRLALKIQHLECAMVSLQTTKLYDLLPTRHVSMTIIIIDINECETNQHNCSDRMNCRNTNGSYECTCKEGYNFSMGYEEECQGI